MTPLYLASQILVLVGLVFDLTGRAMKKKTFVLLCMMIAVAFYIASYICLKQLLPAVINGIHMIRNIVYMRLNGKDKPFHSYFLPMSCAVLSSVPLIAVFWSDATDLFMLASVIILSLGLALKNMLTVRLCLIANNTLWCIYNFGFKGYANMACDAVNVLVSVIAILIYNVILPFGKRKKKNSFKTAEE